MKTLIQFKPSFDPISKTLDFSLFPGFSLTKVYAVINVTRNTPIYIPGIADYGISSVVGSLVTLSFNTTSHSSSDILNVYYEAQPGFESNTPEEFGGQLQMMQETLNQILVELKLQNYIMTEGFSRTVSIRTEELQQLRDDINNPLNTITTSQ
jgi:hypothetical protein